MSVVAWFPAQKTVPAPDERLQLVLRMVSPDVQEVCIYKHGTVVARRPTDPPANEILAEFDLPGEGEGGPAGDIDPTEFDDGVILFSWGENVSYLATVDELAELRGVKLSSTELFLVEEGSSGASTPLAVLVAGIGARRRRSQDAGSLEVVVRWSAQSS